MIFHNSPCYEAIWHQCRQFAVYYAVFNMTFQEISGNDAEILNSFTALLPLCYLSENEKFSITSLKFSNNQVFI